MPPCPSDYGDIERAEHEARRALLPHIAPFPFCPHPLPST